MFINFAKKQSDNLEQQEASPLGGGPSTLQRLINLLKSRPANTELNALISEGPEELESDDDEGLISFEEERVRQWPLEGPVLNIWLDLLFLYMVPKLDRLRINTPIIDWYQYLQHRGFAAS